MHAAKEQGIHLNEIPAFTNLKQVLERKHNFYCLELPCEEEDSEKYLCDRYLVEIRSKSFPLNFGRDVVAGELLLNLPERIDWRECVLPQVGLFLRRLYFVKKNLIFYFLFRKRKKGCQLSSDRRLSHLILRCKIESIIMYIIYYIQFSTAK